MAGSGATTSSAKALIRTLHDGPIMARYTATKELLEIANADPGKWKILAEGGVMALLPSVYVHIQGHPEAAQFATLAGTLARALLEFGGTVAARDLQRAILYLDPRRTFAALVLLQDCLSMSGGTFLKSLDTAGVVRTLVSTLAHDSPFCVAAAAGALGWVAERPGEGKSMFQASGALNAMLAIIERSPRPASPQERMGLFRRAVYTRKVDGQSDPVHSHDPTALAIAGLCAACSDSEALFDDFIVAPGIPALVDVLAELKCPVTLAYTLDFIAMLEAEIIAPGTPEFCQDFAENYLMGRALPEKPPCFQELHDALFDIELCPAALNAWRIENKGLRKMVLDVVVKFLVPLSTQYRPAALAVLVAGNAVEFLVREMTEGGVATLGNGIVLLQAFLSFPHARQRLSTKEVMDQLIQLVAKWLEKADLETTEAFFTTKLMLTLLDGFGPHIRPAAVKGNVTPGLVRVMRKFGSDPAALVRNSSLTFAVVDASLDSLCHMMHHEKQNPTGLWKPAYDAGIVPAICDMLTHVKRDEVLATKLVKLSSRLVKVTPRGEDIRWIVTLPRAIAGLLIVKPPVIPVRAANCLATFCGLYPDLYREFHLWGLRKALKRLSSHRDLETARAAKQLLTLSFSASEALAAGLHDHLRSQEDWAASFTVPAKVRVCQQCGFTPDMTENGKLRGCSGCNSVRYCGRACQKEHWPAHKAECKRLQAAAAAAAR